MGAEDKSKLKWETFFSDYTYIVSSVHEVLYIIRVLFLAPIYIILARILQWIINLVCGPHHAHYLQDKAVSYDILWDLKYHFVIRNALNCFLRKFREVQDISVVEDEDVSLYCVNDTDFVFARARPGTDLFDCDKHPFLFLAQHNTAIELIIVSHQALFRYINNKPYYDGRNITLSYMNGRCGSTLAASMIHRTRQCTVVSEPWAMLDIVERGHIQRENPKLRAQMHNLTKAAILMIAKDPKRKYFIKMGMVTGVLVKAIKDIFPAAKEIYMYRAFRPTMMSYRKLFGPFAMTILSGLVVPRCIGKDKHWDIWHRNKTSNPYKRFFIWMFCNMEYFYEEAKTRTDIESYSYESFLADREGYIRHLLGAMGIGPEYVKLAMTATHHDSQENSPWSRKKLAGKYGKLPEDTFQWAKRVAKEFGVHCEGEDYSITNFPNGWETKSR